jgi:hypothetical protein
MPSASIPAFSLAFLATALLLTASTDAAPPGNSDPALAPWFQSLRQPETGMSCCSISDCRPVDYRSTGDGYEVFIDGNWLPVPPKKVLQRTDTPLGRGVVCYTPAHGIMCFVRTTET